LARDRAIGAALVVGAIIGVIVYGSLMFIPPINKYSVAVLEITAFVAVLAILAVLGWIGYVMATTPPPVPLEPEPAPSSSDAKTESGSKSMTSEKKTT